MSFQRLRCIVVSVGNFFYYKEVTNTAILDKLTTIHPDAMTEVELQAFQASQHNDFHEMEEGLPLLRVWLIRGKDEPVMYIVTKQYH